MEKWVYKFGNGTAEGNAEMRELLGGKGANLAEMSRIGLPVPPGFTISTVVCDWYDNHGKSFPDNLSTQVEQGLAATEALIGAKFGDADNPLLVAVRSGARVSMPGMMDTVLNLGLNDQTVEGLASKSGDPRFAYDSYRRFIQMYADVVLGVESYLFEELLEDTKQNNALTHDTELDVTQLKNLCNAFKTLVKNELGFPFPQDPNQQLWEAIHAVFSSWMTPRAVIYRSLNAIPNDWGTAVNIQAMVFGNMGEDCLTGVAFTRDPSSGENVFFGEFLPNAQGEDVVAGLRTPLPLTIFSKEKLQSNDLALEETYPDIFAQLERVRQILETHYRDMQDIEFTVQKGTLYMLQTRNGKRTAAAAMRIACDMVDEGLISENEALMRIEPRSFDVIMHPRLDPSAPRTVITKGLPASPGAVCGQVVFTADAAEKSAHNGEKVILVRLETAPEDIHGMYAAEGILTVRGGMTSHAAVVARGMGRACICGASEILIDQQAEKFYVADKTINKGDLITLDGTTGEVMLGAIATVQPDLGGNFRRLMQWADKTRRLKVRVNAETPGDVRIAYDYGAEGIGLCRTEHMFFEGDRINAMREMIMAENAEGRRRALAKILPMQRDDFSELFSIMAGTPVTVRLLDPPLHEFLPKEQGEFKKLADASGLSLEKVIQRVKALQESNPMLGHRGCRLLTSYPEICEMQARAIFEAYAEVSKQNKDSIICEIMIPLVAIEKELKNLKAVIDKVASEVEKETGVKPSYKVGTMIELPRAALQAGEIAKTAEFFSFGTNDLTQMTYGMSRDDSSLFLSHYEKRGIIDFDPFSTLDIDGVGALVELASKAGRQTRPALSLGLCGEHGGDPKSIAFCHNIGLDYIACSPYRIPIARLAAAQAAIKQAQIKTD